MDFVFTQRAAPVERHVKSCKAGGIGKFPDVVREMLAGTGHGESFDVYKDTYK